MVDQALCTIQNAAGEAPLCAWQDFSTDFVCCHLLGQSLYRYQAAAAESASHESVGAGDAADVA